MFVRNGTIEKFLENGACKTGMLKGCDLKGLIAQKITNLVIADLEKEW